MEIIQQAKVCAVNSAVSELRRNGRTIHCEQRGRSWFYRMEAQGEPRKICQDCGAAKVRGEFYRHPSTLDGLTPRCKDCHKEYIRSRRR